MQKQRVFVSSRFEEFALLRENLRHVLRREGFEVIDLNDGRADGRSALRRSLDEVAGVDVLVLLLGETYASDEADLAPDQLSPTHQEWQLAIEEPVPVVLAWKLPPTAGWTERSKQFLAEVEQRQVAGLLSTKWELEAEAIAAQVGDALVGTSDDGDDDAIGTDVATLVSDLQRLGAIDASFRFERTDTASSAAADLVQHRQWALDALVQGNPDEAERQLDQATERYAGDWATLYMQARITRGRSRTRTEPSSAELARNAASAVGVVDLCPLIGAGSEVGAAKLLNVRASATHALHAQLLLDADDPAAAVRAAAAATTADPFSRTAWSISLIAATAADRADLVDATVERLFDLYPTYLVRVLRQVADTPAGDRAQRCAVDLLRVESSQRAEHLDLGPRTEPLGYAGALSLVRRQAAQARAALRAEVEPLVTALADDRREHGSVILPPAPTDGDGLVEPPGLTVARLARGAADAFASPVLERDGSPDPDAVQMCATALIGRDVRLPDGSFDVDALTAAREAAHAELDRLDAEPRPAPPKRDGGIEGAKLMEPAALHRSGVRFAIGAGVVGLIALRLAFYALHHGDSLVGKGVGIGAGLLCLVATCIALVLAVGSRNDFRDEKYKVWYDADRDATETRSAAASRAEQLDALGLLAEIVNRRVRRTSEGVDALHQRRRAVAERAGDPDIGAAAARVQDTKAAFDRSFARRPNLWFADYVPIARAGAGALSRIDGERAGGRPQLVRVQRVQHRADPAEVSTILDVAMDPATSRAVTDAIEAWAGSPAQASEASA